MTNGTTNSPRREQESIDREYHVECDCSYAIVDNTHDYRAGAEAIQHVHDGLFHPEGGRAEVVAR